MRSYRLEGSGTEPLMLRDTAQPEPRPHEIVVRAFAPPRSTGAIR